MDGRLCMLNIQLVDKPGQLVQVSEVIAGMGANVVSVNHERSTDSEDVNACELRIKMETRNAEHIQAIKEMLRNKGFLLK